ncbi:hypothetical protein BC832DRAFT_392278 [Gaertneriomyces semiglobifer]|nr:hypothetical protein BC832DRAFT_392278 [Gaertneriomyces semiglobifer]
MERMSYLLRQHLQSPLHARRLPATQFLTPLTIPYVKASLVKEETRNGEEIMVWNVTMRQDAIAEKMVLMPFAIEWQTLARQLHTEPIVRLSEWGECQIVRGCEKRSASCCGLLVKMKGAVDVSWDGREECGESGLFMRRPDVCWFLGWRMV